MLPVARVQGPLALWFVALVAVYTTCLFEVDGLQGPLAALNMAMHVIYRFSYVRALAFFAMSQARGQQTQLYRMRGLSMHPQPTTAVNAPVPVCSLLTVPLRLHCLLHAAAAAAD